jgi:hypothetical protein
MIRVYLPTELLKARGLPVPDGTVSYHGGKRVMKVKGKWVQMKEGRQGNSSVFKEAKLLGADAFKAGLPKQPFKDPKIMRLVEQNQNESGVTAEALKQWNAGWDAANAADDSWKEER